MKTAARAYLRLTAAGCLSALAAISALNLAADPQLIWGSPWGVELLKYRTTNWSRALKAELMRRSRADLLLIGTSVTNTGFDPEGPALRGRGAFNSGWVSGQISEILAGLELALSTHVPKEIIYCLDFRSFSDSKPIAQFNESRLNSKLDATNYFLSGLVGYGATRESTQLLWARLSGVPANVCRTNGFNDTPPSKDPGDRLEAWCRMWLRNGPKAPKENSGEAQFRNFERILDLCALHRIKLTLCFTPHHAAHAMLLDAGGLGEFHDDWKRRVARTVWARNRKLPPGGEPIRIWNFSNLDGPLVAPWTGQAAGEGADHWFIDPGHARAALGELVMSQLLGVASSGGPSGWVPGVELTEANEDDVFRGEREARDRYAHSGSLDVPVIWRIAREMGFAGPAGGSAAAGG